MRPASRLAGRSFTQRGTSQRSSCPACPGSCCCQTPGERRARSRHGITPSRCGSSGASSTCDPATNRAPRGVMTRRDFAWPPAHGAGLLVLSSGPGRADRATCRLSAVCRRWPSVVRRPLPVLNTISESSDRMQRLFTGNVWEVDNRGTQSLAAKGVGMMASRRRLGQVRACRPPGSARKQAVAGSTVRSCRTACDPCGHSRTALQLILRRQWR